MTPAEFRAWLDANFPDHAKRGRGSEGHRGIKAAADELGVSVKSIVRKRDGAQPITARDAKIIQLADRRTGPPAAASQT